MKELSNSAHVALRYTHVCLKLWYVKHSFKFSSVTTNLQQGIFSPISEKSDELI